LVPGAAPGRPFNCYWEWITVKTNPPCMPHLNYKCEGLGSGVGSFNDTLIDGSKLAATFMISQCMFSLMPGYPVKTRRGAYCTKRDEERAGVERSGVDWSGDAGFANKYTPHIRCQAQTPEA
jgi:hypothetical protein